jgi:hypothetical protein
MTINSLNPYSLVMINDVVSGGRKLGQVDATGLGYFDLRGDSEIPKVLHSELDPTEVGSIALWIVEKNNDMQELLTEAWSSLTRMNLDDLTIARAMRYAVVNNVADVDVLVTMGRAATQAIIDGRRLTDASLAA